MSLMLGNGFLFSCFILVDFLAWYLLFSVNHIHNNFQPTVFSINCHCVMSFFTFLHLSLPSFSILSILAPPTPKHFCFLRSKSQDKLLSPRSSSSSRPSLSLTRRLRFWSSTDITADGVTSQPMSANGVFQNPSPRHRF